MNIDSRRKKNRRALLIGIIAVVGVFAFGYAMVPFYNVLCRVLGLNGKTDNNAAQNVARIDKTRTVTVTFVSQNNEDLPWKFYPMTKKVELHPGQNMKIAYFAQNDANHPMTVQAIPSVTPGLAAVHLKKTECFCFNQQTLKAHQTMKMPLIFHLDNTLPKNINEITLSYTLFKAKKVNSRKAAGKLG